MSAVVRLRERVYAERSTWHVEVWRGGAMQNPTATYATRDTARTAAGQLARDLGAVVVLAGQDPIVAAGADEDLPF